MRLLKSRLDPATKGYHCHGCEEIYIKTKGAKKPACWENKCPVADIAPDLGLNLKIKAFADVEMLNESPGYQDFQRRLLTESGLAEETPETILEMKRILEDYRARRREEQANQANRKRR